LNSAGLGTKLTKSQKKRAKQKLKKAQQKTSTKEPIAHKDLVEVKTSSGTTRTINCAFKEHATKNQKDLQDNMEAALMNFCIYYAFQQEKWMRGGVGGVKAAGSGGIDGTGVRKGANISSKDRSFSSGREHAKLAGKRAHCESNHRRPSYADEYDESSDDKDDGGWSSESGDSHSESENDMRRSGSCRIATTTVPSQSSGVTTTMDDKSWGQLVVQDPFVPDRNVTPFCNGWRLRHMCKVFEKAYMTLTEQIDETDDEDLDMEEEVFGNSLEIDSFRDATCRGTPHGLAQLMRDIHDPVLGRLCSFGGLHGSA
jgi:hypothetical protein